MAKKKKSTSMNGFFLRATGKKTHGILYYRFSRKGVSMTIWTGISVDIRKWDAAIQSPSKWRDYTIEERIEDNKGNVSFAETAGSKVAHLMDDVVACVNSLIANGETDKDKYQRAIDSIVGRKVYEQEKEAEVDNLNHIRAFYDYFINGIESGMITYGSGNVYAKKSINSWKAFKGILYEICDEQCTFDDIDKFFVDRFNKYINSQGFLINYTNDLSGKMRKLCSLASEYGKNNNAFSLSAWKRKQILKSDMKAAVYLTEDEIDAMYNMDLTGIEEKVRDIFFIGCMTCQRWGDYSRLTKSNFIKNADGIPVVALTQQKTKAYVEIPIVDDRIWAVCEKYNYKFPIIPMETAARNIRVVMRKLADSVPSLNELFLTKLTKSDIRSEEVYKALAKKRDSGSGLTDAERAAFSSKAINMTNIHGDYIWQKDGKGNILKPKFSLIGTHTARRSGITNLYKTGLFNTRELRSVSGHRTDEILDHYIKTTVSEQSTSIYDKLTRLKNEHKEGAKIYRMAK